MKRIFLGLVPWMALVATANAAQVRSADVIYTHFNSVPQRAFRLGEECFVPVDEVNAWGWQAAVQNDEAKIDAEGQSFTVPTRTISGNVTIALGPALEKLHAQCEWVPESDTLEIFTVIDSITSRKGAVEVKSALTTKPNAYILTNPNRVIIDFQGARLGPKTVEDFDVLSRAFQFKRNVVRLVVDTSFLPVVPATPISPSNDFTLDVNPPVVPVTAPVTSTTAPPPPFNNASNSDKPAVSTIPMSVEVDTQTETQFTVGLKPGVSHTPQYQKPDPSTLVLILSASAGTVDPGFRLNTDAVESIESKLDGVNIVLTYHLRRPMGTTVWVDGDLIKVQLLKPDIGNGKLAGKIVVVDPGHGGHDNGAHAYGVREKDLTLAIGRELAKDLAAEGATVIMTRQTDVFIPLTTRADIANSNHADFFISCHINSTGGEGSQSGGITFHHFGKGVSRLLGECIQAEIARVSGVPNLGVWSDGKIYKSGFSVLRNTQMPGVLLELGFINHPRDVRRLCQTEFQKLVPSAVVRGLKVYLGDASAK
jgi:N-acetylmuramoyl-L-alanine amidase